MRKLLLVVVAGAALFLGMSVQRWLGAAPKAEAPQVGDALSAEFPDPAGNSHRLDEWKGRVLVVNFWATWCPPCLEEMPEFVKLQRELGGKGLQFIGVAIDDAQAVKDFLKGSPLNYPVLIGDEDGQAWSAKLGNHAGVLPYSAVFDRSGKLVHVESGPFSREKVSKVITPLL